VFVADEIPSELRRIVEFLNEQMTVTEVLAIEVRQYLAPDSDLITLVPQVIGQTEAARAKKRPGARRIKNLWGESDFVEAVRAEEPGSVGERQIDLYTWMRDHGARTSWGTGSRPGVVMWLGERSDGTSNPVAVYFSPGGMCVYFADARDQRSDDQFRQLVELIRTIPDVATYIEGLEKKDFKSRPRLPAADVLATDDHLDAWKRVLEQAAAPV